MFLLAIDLVKESVFDTIGRISRLEYFTILVMIGVSAYTDFVLGVLAGVILACEPSKRLSVIRLNRCRCLFHGSQFTAQPYSRYV